MSTSSNQTTSKGGQVTSFTSTSHQANHQSPTYNPMITDCDNGRTESTTAPSAGSVASFDPSSTSPTDISLTQPPILSPFAQGKRLTPHAPPDNGNGGKDSHETKRVKTDLESDTPNLDSIDYWINFDDDDVDNWGSFEIDFSKLNDGPQNRFVSASRQNGHCLVDNFHTDVPIGRIRFRDWGQDSTRRLPCRWHKRTSLTM